MKNRNRLGILALVVGGIAVPVAALAAYVRSMVGAGSSFIVDWLLSKGVTFSNPANIYTVSAPSLFSVTDARAVTFVTGLAIVLGVVAMVVALLAEYRRERTLYLSAGYICGALAVFLITSLFGLVAMIAGITAAMVMRHGRGPRDA